MTNLSRIGECVIVSDDTDSSVANSEHGDRYGVDWAYAGSTMTELTKQQTKEATDEAN